MLTRSLLAAMLLLLFNLSATSVFAEDVVPSSRVSSAVLVREGPSTATAILGRLRPGDTARIVGEESGWYQVELPDGTRGYVSKAWTLVGGRSGAPLIGAHYRVHVIDVGTGLAVFGEGKDFSMLYVAGRHADLHAESAR